MCYLVYISTDFEGDLSQHNSALISFEKDFTNADTEIIDLLLYKYHWYVGSKAGCSCTFRHLSSIELGFGEPVYWYEESSDEIEATKIFYDEISSLISKVIRLIVSKSGQEQKRTRSSALKLTYHQYQ